MTNKRITVFAGLAGSGKTSIALSYALYLRRKHPYRRVVLADLDIVNPYFRANDSAALLAENDIRVISSVYANTNLDAPAFPREAQSLFDDMDALGVIDLGGDERGALALGRYSDVLSAEKAKEILMVINCYRPFTRTAHEAAAVKDEIEKAARFTFTGVVNNPNLAECTTTEDIMSSRQTVREISETLGLPVFMTCADEKHIGALEGRLPDLFPIKPYRPFI